MPGGGDDGFFSSEIVLLLVGLVALVLVVQFGLGAFGSWLGEVMTAKAQVP
jgi:hypothetical protein